MEAQDYGCGGLDDSLPYSFAHDDGDAVGLDDGGCGADSEAAADGDFGVYDLWGERVWEFDACAEAVPVF